MVTLKNIHKNKKDFILYFILYINIGINIDIDQKVNVFF